VQEQQKELEKLQMYTVQLQKRVEQQQQEIAKLKSVMQILLKKTCELNERNLK